MQRLSRSSQPGRIDARREFWSIWMSLPGGKNQQRRTGEINELRGERRNRIVGNAVALQLWPFIKQSSSGSLTRELVASVEALCPLHGGDPAGHTDHT